MRPDRLPSEDRARVFAYAGLALWGVVYAIFPPISSQLALDFTLRMIWMSVTVIGAVVAMIGLLKHIDIKMEMPGLTFALLGPLFYTVTQLSFVIAPTSSSGDPASRYALLVYALLPVLFALPRIIGLLSAARRLKRINTESVDTARLLLDQLHSGPVNIPGGDKK